MIDNLAVARAAQYALHAYDLAADWFDDAGFTQHAHVQRFTAAGWLVSCPSHAVLATAGTVGPGTQPLNALQWLDHVDPRMTDIGGGQKVHAIWNERAQGYAAEVLAAAAAQGVTSLDLVGHSYGGALSALLPQYLTGLTVNKIITFASPKVGNAAYVATLPADTYRVERDNDVVPFLPLNTPTWLLALAWQARLGLGGLVLPHCNFSLDYASHGILIWCGNETIPPRKVTVPADLAGLQLRRFGDLVHCLLQPGTALAIAGGHLMDRYASHVAAPIP